MEIQCSPFTKKPFKVYAWDEKEKRVIVIGCEKCKECCGGIAGFQPLHTLPEQKPDLYVYEGVKCIHPSLGCKQLMELGCGLTGSPDKPISCNIFPFRLVGRCLTVQVSCPAVQNTYLFELQQIGMYVLKYLTSLPTDFLESIAEKEYHRCLIDLYLEMSIGGEK